MKRAIVLALSVILALVVAAPTVLAQGNGGAPEDVSTIIIDLPPQDDTDPTSPASFGCDFPVHIEATGKAKLIELPDGGFILTAPGLYVTVTNEDTGEAGNVQHHRFYFREYSGRKRLCGLRDNGQESRLRPRGAFPKQWAIHLHPRRERSRATSRLLNHRRARGKRSTSANSCPRPAS